MAFREEEETLAEVVSMLAVEAGMMPAVEAGMMLLVEVGMTLLVGAAMTLVVEAGMILVVEAAMTKDNLLVNRTPLVFDLMSGVMRMKEDCPTKAIRVREALTARFVKPLVKEA